MLGTSISFKQRATALLQMTVLSRAKEFGFEFWNFGRKKKPPEGGYKTLATQELL
jgi:hypothetical protein